MYNSSQKLALHSASKLTAILILFLISAPSYSVTENWQLRLDGIGPLRVGMRFTEANTQLGNTLERTQVELRPSPGCDYLAVPGHSGIELMFVDDVLRRVDVSSAEIQTTSGIKIGDPVQKVTRIYKNIVITPQDYDESERYFTILSPDKSLAIRFLTSKGKIASFHAGAYRQVQYMEECN